MKHDTQLQHNNEQMLDIFVHIRKVSWFSYPSLKHNRVTLYLNKTLDGVESALSQASQQHKGSTSLPRIQNVRHLNPWHWDPQGLQNVSLALRNQAILSGCDSLAEQLATINTGISINWAFDILFCKASFGVSGSTSDFLWLRYMKHQWIWQPEVHSWFCEFMALQFLLFDQLHFTRSYSKDESNLSWSFALQCNISCGISRRNSNVMEFVPLSSCQKGLTGYSEQFSGQLFDKREKLRSG